MFVVNMQNKFQDTENSGLLSEVMLGIRDYSEMNSSIYKDEEHMTPSLVFMVTCDS